jgi:type II secretory pathway pseudopilin PulG
LGVLSRRGSLNRQHSTLNSFTLLELLVVIGIIALLLVAVVPAVTNMSKSSGRKGAISNIASIIEQARSLALSDARNTYVAFATALPAAATPQMVQDYSYRTYAVFEDNPLGAGRLQVTKWQKLPTGISFRSQNESGGPGTCLTSVSNTTTAAFSFPALGGTISCPYIEFDSTGAIIQPTSASPMRLIVFEGSVSGGTENLTARESSGEPVREEVEIAKFTGRAKYVIR